MTKHFNFKKALSGLVSAAMLASSVPFMTTASVSAADSPNYAEALELSLYFYDANQCGCEVDDNCLTWRGNCHTYDAEASLDNATGLSSSAKSIVSAANGGGNTADVSGGYHDAGDHVKFNLTMGFNAASLSWAYHSYPESFKDTGTEGHLFYILRETADYLMKTTYLDSNGDVAAICQTVSDESDHNVTWEAPETQTYNRPTYWFSGSTINNYVCDLMAAALASTAATLKDSDSQYAAECLKYADAIYNYSRKYSGTDGGGMGNMYNSGSMSPSSAKAWAEAWLYLADSSKYSLPTAKPTSNGCYDYSEYDYWIYSWGKVWGGYACLMADITGDSAYLNEVKFNSDRYSNNNAQQYYIINDWGNSRYNCAWQTYALTYGELANNQSYLDAAKWQMDFILGENPAGYSYLIGYSDKYPTRIHHRAANPDKGDSKYTLYGALVGGASDTSGSITDAVDSYAQTEMALDYNACFTVAIAGLYSNFGGDTTTAKTVIANAPEIDENFDFGGSTQVDPDPETGTATISVVDAETGELVPGATVTLFSSTASTSNSVAPGAFLINEWNSSDENPKTIGNLGIKINDDLYYSYHLTVTPPEGYSLTATMESFDFLDSTNAEITVPLNKIKETTTTTTTTTTTNPIENVIYGDANDNGTVEVADAVYILQGIADPSNDDYKRTAQGEKNADCSSVGNGVDAEDALAIQQFKADIIPSLPVAK